MPQIALQILTTLLGVLPQLISLFQEAKDTLSTTDIAAIKDALAKAEEATAALRPEVDAALAKAAEAG